MITNNKTKSTKKYQKRPSASQKQLLIGISDQQKILQIVNSISKKSVIAIYNIIIQQHSYFNKLGLDMYESRAVIGQMAGGYCEKTVSRAIKELVSYGLLVVEHRLTSSNIYHIPSIVYAMRSKLAPKLKALWNISVKSMLIMAFGLQPLEPNVPANKSIKFNTSVYKYNYSSNTQGSTKDTRDFIKKSQRRRKTMQDISYLRSTPLLDEIENTLNLTKLGKAKLFCFDAGAIYIVWNHVKRLKHVKDPYGLFMISLIRHCESRDIPIHWDIFQLILQKYNMQDTGNYVRQHKTNKLRSHFMVPQQTKIYSHINTKQPNEFWLQFIQDDNIKQDIKNIAANTANCYTNMQPLKPRSAHESV